MSVDRATDKFPGQGHTIGGSMSMSPPRKIRAVSYDSQDRLILEKDDRDVFEWSVAKKILPRLFKSSVPIMLSLFFSISALNLTLFMFAGSYIDDGSFAVPSSQSVVFAGVSLCTMFTNVSLLSVLIGLASAVETLGSQNNGAGNYAETGLTLQRSILILSCVAIPVVFLWMNGADLFGFIGVAPDVCAVIHSFMRVSCHHYTFEFRVYQFKISMLVDSAGCDAYGRVECCL